MCYCWSKEFPVTGIQRLLCDTKREASRSLDNLTLADVYFGKAEGVKNKREEIKKENVETETPTQSTNGSQTLSVIVLMVAAETSNLYRSAIVSSMLRVDRPMAYSLRVFSSSTMVLLETS